jgi:hypothetical protein
MDEEEVIEISAEPEAPEGDPVEQGEATAETNLAFELSKKKKGRELLAALSKRVIGEYEADYEASAGYREKVADIHALFRSELPPKDWPWKNCANGNVPIVFLMLTRAMNRIESEIFPDPFTFMSVAAPSSSPEDKQRAALMTAHDNHQLLYEVADFRRQMSRALYHFLGPGDCSGHSYYDHKLKKNRHETLTVDDLVVPYVHASTMDDYSDCPRLTKVLRLHERELRGSKDVWANVEKVIKRKADGYDDDPEPTLAKETQEDSGVEAPDAEDSDSFTLLEQHRWCPRISAAKATEDEDDFALYRVVVDEHSRQVLDVTLMEEIPAYEQARYQTEARELEIYRAQSAMYEQRVVELGMQVQQQAQVLVDQGMMPDAAIAQVERSIVVPSMPPKPAWMTATQQEPAPPRPMPVHMFSHGVNIENSGTLGIGYGRMLVDYGRMGNTALNQYIDQATLANLWGGLIDESLEFEGDDMVGGALAVQPGEFKRVRGAAGDDLGKHIHELRPPPANPQLMEITRFAQASAEASMQAPDALSGNPGKSNETYRGLATRIEQATKQLSVPATKFLYTFVRNVVANNARLNSTFLEESKTALTFHWQLRQIRETSIRREWYASAPYRFTFTTDLRFASRSERIREADELVAMARMVPTLAQNPAFIYESARRALEARGHHDLVQILGPPPAPPQVDIGQQMQAAQQQAAQQQAQKQQSQAQRPQQPRVQGPGGQPPAAQRPARQ